MLQPGSQSHLPGLASRTKQALQKNTRRGSARKSGTWRSSVECSLLHNHTCPACSCFPLDLAGFGVGLGRKTELSLPSLGCSLNQTPERCGFEYSNGNLTFFWKYFSQSLGMYTKAEHRHHHHCFLRRGRFAQPSQGISAGAFPGDPQLGTPDEHMSLLHPPPTAPTDMSSCTHRRTLGSSYSSARGHTENYHSTNSVQKLK